MENKLNRAAQALGRMAKGVPKQITESDRKRRQQWAAGMAEIRWSKRKVKTK
jgi:hypothetical protein